MWQCFDQRQAQIEGLLSGSCLLFWDSRVLFRVRERPQFTPSTPCLLSGTVPLEWRCSGEGVEAGGSGLGTFTCMSQGWCPSVCKGLEVGTPKPRLVSGWGTISLRGPFSKRFRSRQSGLQGALALLPILVALRARACLGVQRESWPKHLAGPWWQGQPSSPLLEECETHPGQ